MKMKVSFLAVLILFGGAVFAGQAHFMLGVDGMSCPFCVYGVEKRLKKIDGVEDVTTDLAQGKVWVEASGTDVLTEDAARSLVEEAGFTLRAFEVHQPGDHHVVEPEPGQDD